MKSFLSLSFLLLFPVWLFAQSENDKITYLDSSFVKTTEGNHAYYRIIRDYHLEKDTYEIEDYYKSGRIKKKAVSTEKNAYKYTGFLYTYYESGQLSEKKYYEDSQLQGPFLSWHENGNKRVEGTYFPDEASELKAPMLRIDQYWDENNIHQVVDGNGIYKETEDKVTTSGSLQKGLKEGVWKGSDKGLKIEFVETYSGGYLISGISIDKDLVERSYTSILKLAKPKKGIEDFYKFVAKNFKVPDGDISGRIILKFTVDKKGTIKDVEIIQGIEEKTDLEAIRVVQLYNKWEIALSRGIKVACSYSMPINITNSY